MNGYDIILRVLKIIISILNCKPRYIPSDVHPHDENIGGLCIIPNSPFPSLYCCNKMNTTTTMSALGNKMKDSASIENCFLAKYSPIGKNSRI